MRISATQIYIKLRKPLYISYTIMDTISCPKDKFKIILWKVARDTRDTRDTVFEIK
jgi:hypothetical protein